MQPWFAPNGHQRGNRMSYYRGNHHICKTPTAAATWGARDPVRYWRALERINRRQAARKAELDALKFANVATMPDTDADTDQATLPFPLG